MPGKPQRQNQRKLRERSNTAARRLLATCTFRAASRRAFLPARRREPSSLVVIVDWDDETLILYYMLASDYAASQSLAEIAHTRGDASSLAPGFGVSARDFARRGLGQSVCELPGTASDTALVRGNGRAVRCRGNCFHTSLCDAA